MDTLGLPPLSQGDDGGGKGLGLEKRSNTAYEGEGDVTFASDWQVQSLLLFAERTRQLLSAGANASSETHKTLCDLVSKFMGVMVPYYEHGVDQLGDRARLFREGPIKTTPMRYERRRFVERIGEEWALLMSLASSAQLLPENDVALSAIRKVIETATGNLKLREGHQIAVLPHFGRHFELVKFHYAPATVVLGIPVSSLYCPWEWPVIWHEAAGIYIEDIHDQQHSPVTKLAASLRQAMKNDAVWQRWKADYRDILEGLAAVAAANGLSDIVDAEGRPAKRIVRNWAEELVEDAVSVLCLGEGAVATLEQVFVQHYGKPGVSVEAPDFRHPPSQLRLLVAYGLSHRMGLRSADVADEGARVLAQAIFDVKDRITRRTFTQADVSAVADRLAAIERGEVASLDQMEPQGVAATIAAVAQAAYLGSVPAERLREYVYRHSGLFPEGVTIQPDASLVSGLSPINLSDPVFSQSDAGVSVDGHASHDGEVTVWVTFSGGFAHSKGHSGRALWKHSAASHS
jgi:hypothetical protein